MSPITVLDEHIRNRISAGEVVERPASAVKELVENSLDAGADRIVIELDEGGTEGIRITDNGRGMTAAELPLALERHATSKIQTVEDLEAIITMGFRGEALPSIASVSRFAIASCADNNGAGHQLRLEGGSLVAEETIGMARGTIVSADSLFYNAPARRKFMKKPGTELNHIMQAINTLALGNYSVEFILRNNQTEKVHYPGCEIIEDRLLQVFGKDFRVNMLTVSRTIGDFTFTGYGGKPGIHRGNSKNIFSFVNQRYFRGREIMHAVREAYRSHLPSGRWPFAVIMLEVPPDTVDVNVHPAKTEVRFRDGGTIFRLVRGGFAAALQDIQTPLTYSLDARPQQHEDDNSSMITRVAEKQTSSSYIAKQASQAPEALFGGGGDAAVRPDPQPRIGSSGGRKCMQIYNSYIIEERDEGVLVYDQHALHEGILEHRIRTAFAEEGLDIQELLIPEQIELPPADKELLLSWGTVLRDCGFSIQEFSGNTIIIHAVPALFDTSRMSDFVADVLALDENAPDAGTALSGKILEKLINRIACHSSIRAGQKLSAQEITELLQTADACGDAATCAHGRPTFFMIPRVDFEKKFERR